MKPHFAKRLVNLLLGAALFVPVAASSADSPGEHIVSLKVRGNAKVESDAILALLKSHEGDILDGSKVKEDVKTLYDLGYFSDIRFYKKNAPGGIDLVIQVKENPAITKIEFSGMVEVTEDSLKDKLKTKLYTIVNEATITSDLRIIEKEYTEKGFYLAKATYTLDSAGPNDTTLTFHVDEGGELKVGDVFILGNKYFSTGHIIGELALRPLTRSNAFSSSAGPGTSLFKEDFLKRDTEFLSYMYRDQGFAEVKVGKPITVLDSDREFVRITYQVEEGLQYNVGSYDVSGDLLFTKEELFKDMKLKPDKLFRHSQFLADIEMLVDKYGDLGYAYVDVNPKVTYNREARTVAINYEITKGEKVYFGDMTITGNVKTRDNVIRREMTVHDGELYSGTRLTASKKDIERLGFFEEVTVQKERDVKVDDQMNLKLKVKEKPTGQLQAAIGYTPGQSTSQANWFGQGRYDEKNQSGRAYETNFTAKWNGDRNYNVSAEFFNPRVNDSWWSSGTKAYVNQEIIKVAGDVEVQRKTYGGNVSVGRRLIELIHGTMFYELEKTIEKSDQFLLNRFLDTGIGSSIIARISRNDTDNRLDPSSGTDVKINQRFTGGPLLHGDFQYMESWVDSSFYYPLEIADSLRTYFHLGATVGYIYPSFTGTSVPLQKRYRFGGYDDMRGFDFYSIGPTFDILQAPGGGARPFVIGGDKKLLFQFEYFVPVIPEAGIKAIAFTDMGRIYNEDEMISLQNMNRDYGFGFRWITPIAPFRFEWAYPIVDGHTGDMKFIFYIGY